MKEFFEDGELLLLVDEMAQRYHTTPSELLCYQTIAEFNLNVAIMIAAGIKGKGGVPKTVKDWKKFGIDRVVQKDVK